MNSKWGCWSHKIKGQCYMEQIEVLDSEIQRIKDYLEGVEKKQVQLKQALQHSNFAELLKIEGDYLDGYTLLIDERQVINPFKKVISQEVCTCTPDTCEGNFWYKTRLKESLKNNLSEVVEKYNNLLSVCLQLQYFYKHTSPQMTYAHYFLKTIETPERVMVLCSEITNFLKNFSKQNQGRLYLFTSDTPTQVAPESYLEFNCEKGVLYVLHLQLALIHRGLEEVLLSGVETFAKVLSSSLSSKRYLPISKIQGELGLEKYASREKLVKAYLKNKFTAHGKDYPDGTYLPYQIMSKNI